jgi:hypothetical protein
LYTVTIADIGQWPSTRDHDSVVVNATFNPQSRISRELCSSRQRQRPSDPFTTKRLIFVGPARARPLDGIAAERLARGVAYPTSHNDPFVVNYYPDLPVEAGKSDVAGFTRACAVFGTVNAFADSLELDSTQSGMN